MMKLKTYKPNKKKTLVNNYFVHKPSKNAKYSLALTLKHFRFATNAILGFT